MKTMIKKATAVAFGTLSSFVLFGQVGLGLTSTTDAVVKASANAAAITKTVAAVNSAVTSITAAGINSGVVIKANTMGLVDASKTEVVNTAAQTKNAIKDNSSGNAEANGSVQTSTEGSSSMMSSSSGASAEANAKIGADGKPVIEKAEATSDKVVTKAEKTVNVVIEKSKSLKTSAQSDTEISSSGSTTVSHK